MDGVEGPSMDGITESILGSFSLALHSAVYATAAQSLKAKAEMALLEARWQSANRAFEFQRAMFRIRYPSATAQMASGEFEELENAVKLMGQGYQLKAAGMCDVKPLPKKEAA